MGSPSRPFVAIAFRVLVGAFFIAYPVLVWLGLSHQSPRWLALMLLCLAAPVAALRMAKSRSTGMRGLAWAPLITVLGLAGSALLDQAGFMLVVPVAMSALFLAAFGSSLRAGAMPMVERFARLHERELSPEQIAWCRLWTVIWSVFFWEKMGIDDPVGAISVHGVCGAFGVLSLGLFADGSYGDGYNVVSGGVGGLFYGFGAKQLLAQAIGVGVCTGWNVIVGGITFFVIGKILGTNRVPAEVEIAGLDIPEVGVLGYPEFVIQKEYTGVENVEPHAASIPADGRKRFALVVDGVSAGELAEAWSKLCTPTSAPTAPEFSKVYPKFTTMQGNRFKFKDGDPNEVKSALQTILKRVLPKELTVRTE